VACLARWRAVRSFGIVFVGLVLLAGCTDMPAVPLVPASAVTSTPVATDTSQVVVGVDGIGGGYNPHALADQSSVTTALGELLLPSVFRTAPDGTPQLDTNLMVSAAVTSASPFTVTYQLRTDASWSDGTPIDAADFVYLRNQLSTEPGALDAAGYRLISDITARDNGKTIQVTFAKAYPGWRSLFTDLLPAHLLKDAPGGWDSALTDSFPATAGPFDIKSLDSAGGEIVLERSDRFWGTPSVLDQVVLRKADHQDMAAGLRSGADQLAYTRTDQAGLTLLQTLATAGTVNLSSVPRGELAAVLLRPAGPDLADQSVRTAVAAAINRDALITAGTGGGPSDALRANALVVAPTQPGYQPTLAANAVPAVPDPAVTQAQLTTAGYRQTGGQWLRDGQPLKVVVAATAGVEPYLSIAKLVQQQLVTAGIQATLITPQAGQLYGTDLSATSTTSTANGGSAAADPDIVVGPQPVDTDSASALASWFGCPQQLPGGTTLAPANPLGFCDHTVQPDIDAALTGEMSLSDALAKVEPAVWSAAVEIPLFQLADVLAVGKQVTGVTAGAPLVGPFAGAATWNRLAG
jgi:ABC-type transport system substrate-binding protein